MLTAVVRCPRIFWPVVPTLVAATLFAAAATGQAAGQPSGRATQAMQMEQEGKLSEAAYVWREVVKEDHETRRLGKSGRCTFSLSNFRMQSLLIARLLLLIPSCRESS